jgi:hypothetical protein
MNQTSQIVTFDAYNETLESEKEKEDKLTNIEAQFNTMQSQMQALLNALGKMNQSDKNLFAKHMFNHGLYRTENK